MAQIDRASDDQLQLQNTISNLSGQVRDILDYLNLRQNLHFNKKDGFMSLCTLTWRQASLYNIYNTFDYL